MDVLRHLEYVQHVPARMFSGIFTVLFCLMFGGRYFRLVCYMVAHFLHRPIPISKNPKYHPWQVAAVFSTTDLLKPTFIKVMDSALKHGAGKVFVTSGGAKASDQMAKFLALFKGVDHDNRIKLLWRPSAGRRKQTADAMHLIKKEYEWIEFIIIADDHTYWPSNVDTFIPSLLAPFEQNEKIGGVGAPVEVIHFGLPWNSTAAVMNHIGMAYLQRRKYEFIGTNTIDGGLSCLSSRFAMFRAEIYTDDEFLDGYEHDSPTKIRCTWSWRWPFWTINEKKTVHNLEGGDDKYHTAYLVKKHLKIKIQGGPMSTVTTELCPTWPNYIEKCKRWNRSTFQKNPIQLKDKALWLQYPFTALNVIFYAFFRFPAFYEPVMMLFYFGMLREQGYETGFGTAVLHMAVWIVFFKFVKVAPIYRKHPRDLIYFPLYLAFTYYMTYIKYKAATTTDDDTWIVNTEVSKTKDVKIEVADSNGETPLPSPLLEKLKGH